MSILRLKKKKDCDASCPYDCKECRREAKWFRAYEKAERKEAKRIAREACKSGWNK